MNSASKIVYLVEGECEKSMVDAIKNKYILSGVTQVFNVLQKTITNTRIRIYSPKTCVVIIFDTDVVDSDKISKLSLNVKKLKLSKNISDIIIIPQISNFEDEIIYSTKLKRIRDFFDSKTDSEFKGKFNKNGMNNLRKLEEHEFDIMKFWSRNHNVEYKEFKNNSQKIKIGK